MSLASKVGDWLDVRTGYRALVAHSQRASHAHSGTQRFEPNLRFPDKASVDPHVDGVIRVITIRVGTNPTVEMFCGVQRLRGITHVMPHDAHNVSDVLARDNIVSA